MTASDNATPGADEPYTCSVTLIVTGHDLNPDEITEILGAPPDQSWKRGDIKTFKSGGEFIYPWGGWKRFQPDDTLRLPLEQQVAYWLWLLKPKALGLKTITETGCVPILDCYLAFDRGASFTFRNELLQELAQCHVSLDLQCYSGKE